MEHDIDIAMVDAVENDAVRLRSTAEQGGTDLALSGSFQLRARLSRRVLKKELSPILGDGVMDQAAAVWA
jgi:hypothetical protein